MRHDRSNAWILAMALAAALVTSVASANAGEWTGRGEQIGLAADGDGSFIAPANGASFPIICLSPTGRYMDAGKVSWTRALILAAKLSNQNVHLVWFDDGGTGSCGPNHPDFAHLGIW